MAPNIDISSQAITRYIPVMVKKTSKLRKVADSTRCASEVSSKAEIYEHTLDVKVSMMNWLDNAG